jgi:hypothetical protein
MRFFPSAAKAALATSFLIPVTVFINSPKIIRVQKMIARG